MLTLGIGLADITPPPGLALSGWPARRYGGEVHRPLQVRGLWVSDGTRTCVVVTLDVLGLSSALCRQIRARIGDGLGVPPAAVMLACSHTHSGVVLPPWRIAGVGVDETYLGLLTERVVFCCAEAAGSAVPVRVGYGRGVGDLGVSRRLPWDGGRVGFPPRADRDGPVDPEVGVLRFDDETGNPVAILFSYGCHPTVGGPSEWIGPDYPGAARTAVEEAFPSAMAAFVLGNCGDVRSDYTNPDGSFRWDTSPALVDEAGRRVGAVAAKVAGETRTESTSTLRLGRAIRPVYTQHGELIEDSEFLAFRIGDVAVVSNPAECFSSIGLEVRHATPRPILFASVTNGFFGYVPTEDAYQVGGYEVELSWKYFGLGEPVRRDAHGVFREGMLAALAECDGGAGS